MGVSPRLADVQCTPFRFQPGDRILVKVKHPITNEQAARIRKTVEKWAGNMVEVLVTDTTLMEIEVDTPRIIR